MMKWITDGSGVVALMLALMAAAATASDEAAKGAQDADLLGNVRQLTFAGRRSGEGYFSADGTKMVFQSEREEGNPFYQIYLLDLETGDVQRISPGEGKTTCAWIHPSGGKVLFASTHRDPQAKAKQEEEIELRASGKERRYAWDYDEHFELYAKDLSTGEMHRLTDAKGYDAEGSYSPDGKRIAWASNRHAYTDELSNTDAARFKIDRSYLIDIYIADADGSEVQRLTEAAGYDGGPFFSADGKKICWRRFSPDGVTAEIWTMNVDGSGKKQLTRMGAMSWAPYFHPSGEYLIFATNRHGFANFELYLVDAEGEREPVRVTDREGFDGLACFSPDGTKLAWTSNATAKKQSQIFIADWDHDAAMRLLESGTQTGAAIASDDLKAHVEYLASEKLEGRLTGTPGEELATEYAARAMTKIGLQPAGEDGGFYQPFEFTAGVSLGDGNMLVLQREDGKPVPYAIEESWRPLAFSKAGTIEAAPVVFAGYGIVAPKTDELPDYDSYVHLDVKDKWVLVLRYLPEDVDDATRQHLGRHASLRHKAMVARDKGAAGLIVVSGPNSKVKDQLVPLSSDASLAGTSIGVISVTDDVAAAWLNPADRDLKQLQATLDKGEAVMGFDVPGVALAATIDIEQEKRTGRNVLGRLMAGDEPSAQAIVVGAHIDHLGRGRHSGSRDRDADEDDIHYGADDNASGVAAVLEIAEWLADMKRRGKLKMKRDVVFALWSGEEIGLIGSSHYVNHAKPHPHAKLSDTIAATVNLDMVGRYDEKLVLQGTGSSGAWATMIEQANVPVGLKLSINPDAYLPTDSTPFYAAGVPVLNAFTGAHADYHTPGDTADKINYEGAERIARLMALIVRQLAQRDDAPDYIAMQAPTSGQRAGLRAYLGTIPDYAGKVDGVKLSGVAVNGPASKAGVKAGDVIVELGGKKVENIYDYTYAIDALKIGEATTIKVRRGEEILDLKITPASRE